MFVDKLQSELVKLNREIKCVEAEKQSCIEEITAQKQQVKFLHYQLQQISNITKVYRLSDQFRSYLLTTVQNNSTLEYLLICINY